MQACQRMHRERKNLLRLAGIAARLYNATCSARTFSRSNPAGDLSEGEPHHETHHFDYLAAALREANRFRAGLGARKPGKISAPPRVGHRQRDRRPDSNEKMF